ncbi:acyl-CoA dehydrogenase family protein [Nocardioides speluncae]|uniref:acyl-CoA dehydrogenase family protein n=1 Tax=Nocardioides speluncae TaxID=2670337 RepID=UPI000D692A94|nr:acyl-CoA dehydrogenase family protein [Nocardioides speluncae]
MRFALSEEQQELASTVRTLLARRSDPAAVRAAMTSDQGYDAALWQTLCEQIGVAALLVPEEYDGAGATLVEAHVVLEELGRALTPGPALASLVATAALLGADEDARKRLLPRIATGEIATVAWGEAVLHGDQAEILLVAADDRLYEVDATAVTRTWTPAMDLTTRLATVNLDDAAMTQIGDAAAVAHAHAVGTIGVTALQVGLAERALEMTVSYTKERVQFGRPLASFQALKHRMAQMLVDVETSRSISWAAAYAVATGAPDADDLTAAASSYCSEALQRIGAETVQLHGGIAITWEHDAQLVFKRAHALGQLFGQPHERRATLL